MSAPLTLGLKDTWPYLLDTIRNHYWHLRAIRPWQQAKRRKLYRQIKKVKIILARDGFDPEELRLYCRQFTSCNPAAITRYEQYLQKRDGQTQKTQSA